jgi:multiple sugar transport system substrate-binding protein
VENLTKNPGDWEAYQAQQFMKLYPNVTINTQLVANSDLTTKLTAAFSANQQPDIIRGGWQPQQAVVNSVPDQYEDLSKLVPDAYARLTPYFQQLGTSNGALTFYPFKAYVGGLGVNRGLLTQVGVTFPESGVWTREDFEAACAKVVIPGKRWCVAMQVANPTLEPLGWFWSSGAEFLNADHTQVLLNSPAGVDALTWLISLKDKGYLFPGETTAQYQDDPQALVDGKVAFAVGQGYVSSSSYLATLGSPTPGFQFDTLPYAQKDGIKNGGLAVLPGAFTVTKQTDPNKKAWVAAFLDYLVSAQYMSQYQEAVGGIPIINNAPPVGGQYAEMLARQNQYVATLGLNDEGFQAKNFSKLVTDFYPALQAAFLGTKTPQQALDDYVKQGNADLTGP